MALFLAAEGGISSTRRLQPKAEEKKARSAASALSRAGLARSRRDLTFPNHRPLREDAGAPRDFRRARCAATSRAATGGRARDTARSHKSHRRSPATATPKMVAWRATNPGQPPSGRPFASASKARTVGVSPQRAPREGDQLLLLPFGPMIGYCSTHPATRAEPEAILGLRHGLAARRTV